MRATPARSGEVGTALLAAGGDAEGNAAVVYTEPSGLAARLLLSGYDAAGPRLAVTAPDRGLVWQPLAFSVAGRDVWSGPLKTAAWDFGDGATAAGLSVTHAFGLAGPRTVRVRGEDGVGNATTAAREVTIVPTPAPAPTPTPTPTPPPGDTRPPVVSDLAISPIPPLAGRPATLRLRSDEAGRLDVTLVRGAVRRTITRPIGAGLQRVSLGRLAAGSWRITAAVTDAVGNASIPRLLVVRVVRASAAERASKRRVEQRRGPA